MERMAAMPVKTGEMLEKNTTTGKAAAPVSMAIIWGGGRCGVCIVKGGEVFRPPQSFSR